MNIKKEKSGANSNGPGGSGSSFKILNDERIPTLALPVMTAVPLSPTKQVSLSIAKSKVSPTKKQMEHYVLQTIKNEAGEGDGEIIDFVLTENNGEQQQLGPSGEITEELNLSGDEEEEGDGKTQEIVEHVCGKCYKTFRRFNGLKKHLDFCRFDSGYHLRKAEMLKNLEKIEKDAIIMENKDICFCCGESYDTFHLGHINCPDCPKSFKSQMSYERHVFITHSEFDIYPCTICNAKLRSGNLLKLHMDQHQNRGKPFACKICGKDFTRAYHLKRHQKYSACSASEIDSMNCKVCNKAFYRLDNLRAHLKQHLGTHVAKKPEYMCPQCKNCFYSLSTLNIHTRTHTGERPFDCDLCDKKFPSLVALKKHRRYHTGEKPYTCSECNQSFAVKEVLNRHMKRHTGERPHVCSECGKSFIQATQLRGHIKTHVKPFECTECDEKFKTEKQLERHSVTHNPNYRKRSRVQPGFKCEICNAVFEKETYLHTHIELGLHRQERSKRRKRTDCKICEKNFDTVKNLEFHILKVHEVDPNEVVDEKSQKELSDQAQQSVKEEETTKETPKLASSSGGQIIATGDSNDSGAEVVGNDEGVVLQEFIVDEMPSTSGKQTIILQNEAFTVIPLDSDGVIETVTTNTMFAQIAPSANRELRKSLAESLAAAIADDDEAPKMDVESEEDLKLKENVGKLLDMLVDSGTLKKFGWPNASEENVLCMVIENCGHKLTKDADNYKNCDYATRMREYVKLLFTVVIHNDSIKELLNNYPIDEVIEYVLGNDEDDEDEAESDNGDGSEKEEREEKIDTEQ